MTVSDAMVGSDAGAALPDDGGPAAPAAASAGDAAVARLLGDERSAGAFRKVPRTGVIYVMGEAAKVGYRPGEEPGEDAWCNLGQGAPETGPLPGSPPRCQA